MSGTTSRSTPVRFVRVAETERPTFTLRIDGRAVPAAAGDTLMVALLTQVDTLRDADFGTARRAGFCLMGACQDCWVWTADGARLRACTTPAAPGMAIVTRLRGAAGVADDDAGAPRIVREGVWPRV